MLCVKGEGTYRQRLGICDVFLFNFIFEYIVQLVFILKGIVAWGNLDFKKVKPSQGQATDPVRDFLL